jgi:hypothetical protein
MDNEANKTADLEKQYPILKFFRFAHLPPKLQDISLPFYTLAYEMATVLPGGAEVSAGLRKLLEVKDCCVRAALETKS